MNTTIELGMEIPELDFNNFTDETSGEIDIDGYVYAVLMTLQTIEDEKIKRDINERYFYQKFTKYPNLYISYLVIKRQVWDRAFYKAIKEAFTVGEFYTNDEVKAKLEKIYFSDEVPIDFSYKTPFVIDLSKYGWFTFKRSYYLSTEGKVAGITITKCLLPNEAPFEF